MEHLLNLDKVYDINGTGSLFNGMERCAYFEKELWFELGNITWWKDRPTFKELVKYIHNDIVNPLRVGILHYTERIHEIHDLSKYLPPP